MKQYVNSLEAEKLAGFQVTRQSKQVWNLQLEMAMALLEVCKRHNLQIWYKRHFIRGCATQRFYSLG